MSSELYDELSLSALLACSRRDSSIDHCDLCDLRDTMHRESFNIERGTCDIRDLVDTRAVLGQS
jgi:hypothetical protein